MALDTGGALASLLQVPGLQELLNNGITQQRQNMPLRTAINQQAVNMLPNSAFGRPDMAAIPQANYSTPAPSSGGVGSTLTSMLPILAALTPLLIKALRGGSANAANVPGAGGGSGGGGPLGGLLNMFRGGGRDTTQGNLPQMGGGVQTDPFGTQNGLISSGGLQSPFGPTFTGPTDPSGGTGVGPGMQDYYNSGGGSGGDDSGYDGSYDG